MRELGELRWSLLLLCFCCAPALEGAAQNPDNFQSLARSAEAAREAGKSEEAARDYAQAVALRPDWAEGWYYLGTLEYDQNHYPQAIAALEKLVRLAPRLGAAWSFLGLSEFETKDYINSLAHLEKAQEAGDADDPELARVSTYHLALLWIRNSDFERAAELLRATFGQSQLPVQAKTALGMTLLRIPLLPDEIDPSQDALLEAAGDAARLEPDSTRFSEALAGLIREHPQTPYLHNAYGMALATGGRIKEALAAQQEETRVSPHSDLPWIQIAALELELENREESFHATKQAVELAPKSSVAHLALSKAWRAMGKEAEAAQESRIAESLAPEKPQAEEAVANLYKIHAASGAATGGIQAAAAGDFDAVAQAAKVAQSAGEAEAAIRDYQRAVAMRPEWDTGQWSLAMLYYSTHRFPEAIAALKDWVKRKPEDGTAWAVMGLSEFELKDYDNALLHLERGRQLGLTGGQTALEVATYHLTILLNRKGKFATATDLLGHMAEQKPLAEEIRFALGMAMLRIAALPRDVEASRQSLVESTGEVAELLLASRYDEAFPKLQQLIAQYPAAPFLHYTYGTALDSLSQYDEAKAQMREEIKVSPPNALPWIRLASIDLQQQLAKEALTSAQKAVELDGGSADAHYVLGRAWMVLGETRKAISELETAGKIAPASPEIHFALAKAYAKAGQQDKAVQERANFARLNALAEEQREQQKDQSYRGPHDAARTSVLSTESSAPQ